MIKIAWALVCLDILALVSYLIINAFYQTGRPSDAVEKSFSFAVLAIGLIIILISAIPLFISRTSGVAIFSAIVAALPLIFFAWYIISNKTKEVRESRSPAEVHYSGKKERAIATAISNGDTAELKTLINGYDLNKNGDEDFLQFAIRSKDDTGGKPFNQKTNEAVIRILVEHGCKVQPEMDDVIRCLSPGMISYLVDKGSDVNQKNEYNSKTPLLNAISLNNPDQNEVVKLLISKGADINFLNKEGFTPVMYAAYISNMYESRFSTWALVRYLVEEIHVDIKHTNENGYNLKRIVEDISKEADTQKVSMPADFNWLVNYLKNSSTFTS
jgi:hypothetical protein